MKGNNYNFPYLVINISNYKLYKKYCSEHPYKTKILPEHSSVVKNLTVCFETHSVALNCVLKLVLQASSRNVFISCVICLMSDRTKLCVKIRTVSVKTNVNFV